MINIEPMDLLHKYIEYLSKKKIDEQGEDPHAMGYITAMTEVMEFIPLIEKLEELDKNKNI